jgi:hypothetical protein
MSALARNHFSVVPKPKYRAKANRSSFPIHWLAGFLEGLPTRRTQTMPAIYFRRISFSRDLATCSFGLLPPHRASSGLADANRVPGLWLLDPDGQAGRGAESHVGESATGKCERADRCHDATLNAVLITFPWVVRRYFSRRLDASAGRGYEQGVVWPTPAK